ncbi:MAG: C-GCAxxG-C-C family protein [Butyrivibrio sp.]|nr:C-GCAxxG-C-C family protein [Muribaculum sp.]MCM1553321.1 C-GCAxxG-C-C family protein [Butyrivibrio sp.]
METYNQNYTIDPEKSPRGKAATANFLSGYNCTQAVTLAFADLFDMDERTLLRMSSSFGGGMGRLREVCGTVSGMFLVAGLLYGYDDPKAFDEKAEHYGRIQELARRFRACQGSIVCRELLGLSAGADSPVPERRTQEYYKKRPCGQLAGLAAAILEQFIEENPIESEKTE